MPMCQKVLLTAPGIFLLEKFLALATLETSLNEFNRIGGTFQIQPDAGTNTKTTSERKYEYCLIEMTKDKRKSVFLFFIFAFLTHLHLLQGFNAVITLSQMIGIINSSLLSLHLSMLKNHLHSIYLHLGSPSPLHRHNHPVLLPVLRPRALPELLRPRRSSCSQLALSPSPHVQVLTGKRKHNLARITNPAIGKPIPF